MSAASNSQQLPGTKAVREALSVSINEEAENKKHRLRQALISLCTVEYKGIHDAELNASIDYAKTLRSIEKQCVALFNHYERLKNNILALPATEEQSAVQQTWAGKWTKQLRAFQSILYKYMSLISRASNKGVEVSRVLRNVNEKIEDEVRPAWKELSQEVPEVSEDLEPFEQSVSKVEEEILENEFNAREIIEELYREEILKNSDRVFRELFANSWKPSKEEPTDEQRTITDENGRKIELPIPALPINNKKWDSTVWKAFVPELTESCIAVFESYQQLLKNLESLPPVAEQSDLQRKWAIAWKARLKLDMIPTLQKVWLWVFRFDSQDIEMPQALLDVYEKLREDGTLMSVDLVQKREPSPDPILEAALKALAGLGKPSGS